MAECRQALYAGQHSPPARAYAVHANRDSGLFDRCSAVQLRLFPHMDMRCLCVCASPATERETMRPGAGSAVQTARPSHGGVAARSVGRSTARRRSPESAPPRRGRRAAAQRRRSAPRVHRIVSWACAVLRRQRRRRQGNCGSETAARPGISCRTATQGDVPLPRQHHALPFFISLRRRPTSLVPRSPGRTRAAV